MPESHLKFHSSNGKRTILVVDDEAVNREILGAILCEQYDILYAATAAQALELVRQYQDTLSLILLDLVLPDRHGLEVLRELKAQHILPHLPVIVVTSDKHAEVESLTLGAIDFIPKPYPMPTVILARVMRVIELSEDREILRSTERDHLTGLYNQEFFFRYAEQYDNYHKDTPMDAIVVDVNHFHMINERFGKAYGDAILKRIAENVRGVVQGSGGIVSRHEADTFFIYCPHRSDYADIMDNVTAAMLDDTHTRTHVRLRMGVYSDVDKSIDIERRFDRARLAANTVRNSFSGAIAIYDNALHESEMFEEHLLDCFQDALQQRQFQVYYQPKFDIRPVEPVLSSAEALVRWKHPELGMIGPGVFVPLFEKNGLIQELDGYVWRETARQVREWKRQLGFTVPISVNVSRVDMFDENLFSTITGLVSEFGLTTDDLLLEITESAYTEDSDRIIDTVRQLRKAGFKIEMDDFGTGYSSLNMISNMPIDALKLDMQFVRNAFKGRKDTRMLEVILDIADSLMVPSIAEGVETAEQLFTLKSLGCSIVQGYYFSRPIPAQEFEAFLLARRDRDASKSPVESPWRASGTRPKLHRVMHEKFTYEAMHDPLTGLYNRNAFDMLLKDADKNHIAVLIAEVNDSEALHAVCNTDRLDRVAQRIAAVLRGSFRSVDFICRIRDEEYVVIMTRVDSSLIYLVEGKVAAINDRLMQRDGDLPPVSVSVGVAFADRKNPQGAIYEDAEHALSLIRENPDERCSIY